MCNAQSEIHLFLEEFPAVAVLGPRQIGKTTLAEEMQHLFLTNPSISTLNVLLTKQN